MMEVKCVVSAFVAVGFLIAGVLLGCTWIETGDSAYSVWTIATMAIALASAALCRKIDNDNQR